MINFGNKSNRWLIGFTIAIAFIINSCDYSYIEGFDNIQPYTFSPVIAAPLINSSLGIDDIIGTANFDALHIDDEGLIWLVFRGSVPTISPNNIISFPDQAGSFSFSLHPAIYVQPQVIVRDFQFHLGPTVELNSIKLLSGLLNLRITAPELAAAGYTLSNTFEILDSETGTTTQPVSGIATLVSPARVDLAGNTINISQPGNFITIRHTITLSGSGNPAGGPFNVTVNKSFNNLEYEIITGYWGPTTFPIGGTTITLDLFENLGLEHTTFEAPRVEVVAANSYGIPFDITVDQFVARNTDDNIAINIALPPIYTPWRLNRANMPGDTSITSSYLHRDNSNLGAIAAINPNQYTYVVTGTANPEGRQLNFIRHNSILNLDLEIMVPMWGRVASFEINDTISNPLDTIPQEVEWAELNINIDNGLPIDAYLQVYFADSLGNIIDSLFTEMGTDNFIEAAPANPVTGVANELRHKNIRIMLEQNKIESLRNTRNFIVEATLRTYNQQNQSVKILNTNKLDVRIGARIKAAVDLDLQ